MVFQQKLYKFTFSVEQFLHFQWSLQKTLIKYFRFTLL